MQRLLIACLLTFAASANSQTIPDGCGFYLNDNFSTTLLAFFGDDDVALLKADVQEAVSSGKLGRLAVGENCMFEYFTEENFEKKIGQITGPISTNLPVVPINSLRCKCDHSIFAASAGQFETNRAKANSYRNAKRNKQTPRSAKIAKACPDCNIWPLPRNGCDMFTKVSPFSGQDYRKYSWIFSMTTEETAPDFTQNAADSGKNINDDIEAAVVSDGCILRLYDGINFSNVIANIGGGVTYLNKFQANQASSAKCECGIEYSTSCRKGEVFSAELGRCADISCVSDRMYEGQKIIQQRGRLTVIHACKNGEIVETQECPTGYTFAPCYGYCKPSIKCAPGSVYDDCKVICERNPL